MKSMNFRGEFSISTKKSLKRILKSRFFIYVFGFFRGFGRFFISFVWNYLLFHQFVVISFNVNTMRQLCETVTLEKNLSALFEVFALYSPISSRYFLSTTAKFFNFITGFLVSIFKERCFLLISSLALVAKF